MTLEAVCELVVMVGASIIVGLVALVVLMAVTEIVAFFIKEFGG